MKEVKSFTIHNMGDIKLKITLYSEIGCKGNSVIRNITLKKFVENISLTTHPKAWEYFDKLSKPRIQRALDYLRE